MKSYCLLLAFVVTTLSSCFTVKSNEHFTYRKLPVDRYKQLLDSSQVFYLIDVRTPAEFQKSHVPGAVNYNFLAFHFGRDVDTLDRKRPAYIYCHTCHRSPFAGKVMKRKGFKEVNDLDKGFSQWLKAGYSIDSVQVLDEK